MSSHEEKFERVEERKIDNKHGLEEVRVGMDTGHGDPALNFQPTDATLVSLLTEGRWFPIRFWTCWLRRWYLIRLMVFRLWFPKDENLQIFIIIIFSKVWLPLMF